MASEITYSNPVVLEFSYECGDPPVLRTLKFGEDIKNMPLIGRSNSISRPSDQGFSNSFTTRVTLEGFIEGNDHKDILMQLQLLKDFFHRNDLNFTYKIGSYIIYDNISIYLDGFEEPVSWKQYNSDYSITFHLFEDKCDQYNLGIRCDYVNDQSEVHIFDPTPLWEANATPSREDAFMPMDTPYGEKRSTQIKTTLNGSLRANDRLELKNKMERLASVFKRDGVLTYNGWSNSVRVEDGVKFNQSFPRDYVTYTINLLYYDSDIHSLSIERTFSEIHKHTKVNTRLYCRKTEIEEFHDSPQYVNYSVSLKSKDRTTCRMLLERELSKLIVPGGKRLPGGLETWKDGNEIEYKSQYIYLDPILPNITDDPNIPIGIYSE